MAQRMFGEIKVGASTRRIHDQEKSSRLYIEPRARFLTLHVRTFCDKQPAEKTACADTKPNFIDHPSELCKDCMERLGFNKQADALDGKLSEAEWRRIRGLDSPGA